MTRRVISFLVFDEEDVSLPLLECRWLTISSCISRLSFVMLDNLFRVTTNLENLMIFPDMLICCLKDYPFLHHEEIFDLLEYDYLSFEENIFKVSLQNLKNVKVMPFCICICKPETTKLDQFLKFLLEHAINLEKMVIVPKHKRCNSCSTNISQLMKSLLLFPRTSISAITSLGPVTKNVFDI
ncbi:uncharacterized protein LOC125840137 [Solanum verrucosum]|uniref:uncharacterized protein LOC125840137 n=1 Tax=Solanum verrucosum TaxID=315347 RepID=UPI0020D1584B|nr:uncharacterized protein LOC125840137 [Solanum verrucosum]